MNKKGFTLIEILCVIVLLAITTCFASSSVIKLTIQSKEKLYCTKLALIKSAALNYAQNYEYELTNSKNLYENHPSLTITVADLLKTGHFQADKDNQVLNPKDNSSLNDTKIIIYLENNLIKATIASDNIC